MRTVATAACVALLVLVLGAFQPFATARPDRRPNVLVILTDDQSPETIPHEPAVMPQLQAMLEDPGDHWIRFENAFVSIPLCCPSRASILSGRYPHHTGVLTNEDGGLFDASSTVATWLQGAGYTTGLVGKYLNGYPFGRSPVAPPGWDRWETKIQGDRTSVYQDFAVSRQGFPAIHGDGATDYATDVFTRLAVEFIRAAPEDRPFFLYFAPTAPHPPWTPPPAYDGSWSGLVGEPASFDEADVRDKPAWVRAIGRIDAERRTRLLEARRQEYETLRGVDDAVATLLTELRARGELDDTVIFFLTDNGYAFGEHRWEAKSCPYEECIRTPLLVRYPGATARTDPHLVSTVDLAPTIAALAGVRPGPVDGRSLFPLLEGRSPPDWRAGVLVEFPGGEWIPPWWLVHTEDFVYVEYETGELELYDLRDDPRQLTNLAASAEGRRLGERLGDLLVALRSTPVSAG